MSWNDIKRDSADIAFSEWIRRRDKYCQHCGQPGYGEKGIIGLDASHFKKRRYEATRFDPQNVDALCRKCHKYFEEHQTEHEAWQVEKKGQTIVDILHVVAQTYKAKERKLETIYWKNKIKEDYVTTG